ncbi:MAG: hypothetical protein ABI205_09715 [Gemmatimonadaceae bacterium]
MPPISAPLADALMAGRPQLNARVAEVRHRYPAFDTAAFAAFVRTGVDSVARAVADVAPDRTAFVVSASYDLALELTAQGLVGSAARTDLVDRVWTTLAPRYADLLATEPVEVLGLLSNAVLHIEGVPGARADAWLTTMADFGGQIESIAQLRLLGQVLAWRAGLAHFRDGALLSADALPELIALRALAGATAADWATVRARYHGNRWWSPLPERQAVVRDGLNVGHFTGFGGTFAQPPEVRSCPQGFLVRSGNRFHVLVADVFGAVLLPSTAEELAQAVSESPNARGVLTGSTIVIGDHRVDLQLPTDGLRVTTNEDTIAVSSPYTHMIRLLSCT